MYFYQFTYYLCIKLANVVLKERLNKCSAVEQVDVMTIVEL